MGCPIVKDIFKTEAFKELRRRIGSNEHLFDLYSSYTVAGIASPLELVFPALS